MLFSKSSYTLEMTTPAKSCLKTHGLVHHTPGADLTTNRVRIPSLAFNTHTHKTQQTPKHNVSTETLLSQTNAPQ